MRDVGEIVRLQIQRSSLKTGEKPNRRYDPTPLLTVERLPLTPRGALGPSDGGGPGLGGPPPPPPPTKKQNGVHRAAVGGAARSLAPRARLRGPPSPAG